MNRTNVGDEPRRRQIRAVRLHRLVARLSSDEAMVQSRYRHRSNRALISASCSISHRRTTRRCNVA